MKDKYVFKFKLPYEFAKEKILELAKELGYTWHRKLAGAVLGGIHVHKGIFNPSGLRVKFLDDKDYQLEVEFTFWAKGLRTVHHLLYGGRIVKGGQEDIQSIVKALREAEKKHKKKKR